MNLNQYQLRSFFYGTLLGDSYIHNNTFYCKQISKDLVEFKAKIIKKHLPDANVKILERDGYIDKNGVNHQDFYILSASKCEYIKKLQTIFYPEGKKILNPNIVNKLDVLGLAMWYADDGATVLVGFNNTTKSAKSRRIQLCTDYYSIENHNEIIIPELLTLNLKAKLIDRKNNYRIELKGIDTQLLMCDIGEYFYKYFPSLLYKMDLGYRNESLKNRHYVTQEYNDFYTKISAHPCFKDRIQTRMI